MQSAAPATPAGETGEEARLHPRFEFQGQHRLEVIVRGKRGSILVRNLSCGGASGLCDEALTVGAFITICFADDHLVHARVRWVRMMSIGFGFTRPLAPGFVRRLHKGQGTFMTVRSRQRTA